MEHVAYWLQGSIARRVTAYWYGGVLVVEGYESLPGCIMPQLVGVGQGVDLESACAALALELFPQRAALQAMEG